jgi:hypothetical protein
MTHGRINSTALPNYPGPLRYTLSRQDGRGNARTVDRAQQLVDSRA